MQNRTRLTGWLPLLKPAWAAILAAGSGARLCQATSGIAKQFLEWRGRPLYWHSALAFSRVSAISGLIFVLPEESCEAEAGRINELAKRDNLGLAWKIAPGGARRQDSSYNALCAVPRDCQALLIHDAARCFVTPRLIMGVLERISEAIPGVVPGLPLVDTVKQIGRDNRQRVEKSLERACLIAVQTPQGFFVPALRDAFAQSGGASVTDDCMLLENVGFEIEIVPGDPQNRKITNPEDLAMLAEKNALPCSGFGYDAHRFGPGRPLRLGGVPIPGSWEVVAHSDGDVLLHSLIDALFGCACLGDIGRHFPDSDPAYLGISSALLLNLCLEKVRAAGVQIIHADLTVVAQKPKLAPFAEEIRRNVSRLLAIPANMVNFKATTEEGLGFTGALEGIKAFSLVNGLRSGG